MYIYIERERDREIYESNIPESTAMLTVTDYGEAP